MYYKKAGQLHICVMKRLIGQAEHIKILLFCTAFLSHCGKSCKEISEMWVAKGIFRCANTILQIKMIQQNFIIY
jgi:hypothetical protein